MHSNHRLKPWLVWTAALGACAALIPLFVAWPRLPDPLATHFSYSGAPDGHMSRAGFAAFLVGQSILVVVLGWPRRGSLRGDGTVRGAPVRLAVVAFASSIAVMSSFVTVWHNWDRPTWSAARPFDLIFLPALIGLPLVTSIGLWALAQRWWPSPSSAPAVPDALPLEPGERAYWSGEAKNGWFLLIILVLTLEAGLFHLMLSKYPGANRYVWTIHILAFALLELFSKIRVTVDERGLTIRYGHLGWLKQRIALDRIAAATAFDLEPWEHGGWGYRGSLKLMGRAAVVVRSGQGVRLDLRDGKHFSVSVDDAATAAGLLNGFVRRRSGPDAQSPAQIAGAEAPS